MAGKWHQGGRFLGGLRGSVVSKGGASGRWAAVEEAAAAAAGDDRASYNRLREGDEVGGGGEFFELITLKASCPASCVRGK